MHGATPLMSIDMTDSWSVISQMKIKPSHCLAVTLPGDCLVGVVGGLTEAIDADCHCCGITAPLEQL